MAGACGGGSSSGTGRGRGGGDGMDGRTGRGATADSLPTAAGEGQDDCTARVADLLSIPSGFAAVLLRHYNWSVNELEEKWFSDDHRARDVVGLPMDGVPTVLNDRPLTCGICIDPYSPGEMRLAGCSHYYCHECWRGYISTAVGDGPRCLSLRCPDPSCSVAVVRELVDEVADDEDRERYARFALRSYVEESKKIRWCPGLAAGLLGGEQCKEPLDVFCKCKHSFCLRCGEEAHRSVPCDIVHKWLMKNSSESETVKWVLINTKHCPKCRRAIEKNQGCMHMTCWPPCHHEFCWLCLGPWDEHGNNDYYNCKIHDKAMADGTLTEEKARRVQAIASLDKYLKSYELWAANEKSRQKALEDMGQLQSGGFQKLSAAVGVQPTEFDFLTEAYAQIIDCRRVLRWTHANCYYLDPERDKLKHELFEVLNTGAERWLERLHDCAETERWKLCEEEDGAERYRAYREKLAGLTDMTRTRFGNLVKAFEGDLAEVKPAGDIPIRKAVVSASTILGRGMSTVANANHSDICTVEILL